MDLFVSLIEKYGLLAVFLNVVVEGLGLPFPSYPMLMVAAALAVNRDISPLPILAVGIAGVICADMIWFWSGRRYGTRVIGLLCRISMSPDFCLRKTYALFQRIGAVSLCFTNFIPGFSNIAVVLAGATGVGLGSFLFFNLVGAITYIGVGVFLGLLFHDAIADALNVLTELGRWGMVLVLSLLALYIIGKWVQMRLFIRQLRMDRITVDELRQLIEGGNHPVILDVRAPESRQRDGFIPSSISADLFDVELVSRNLEYDKEVIVYCACPNETSAALLAKHLKKIVATKQLKKAGIKIRPLLGGFDAWADAGQSLEKETITARAA